MIALPPIPPEDEPLFDRSLEDLLRASRRADRCILAMAADPNVTMTPRERELAKRMAVASLRHASDPNTLAVLKLERCAAELAERIDRSFAMTFRINERLAAIETRLGMDIPPEVLPVRLTVKTAAAKSGLSESAIRKAIRQGKIGHVRIGGRVFIDEATTLPARRK